MAQRKKGDALGGKKRTGGKTGDWVRTGGFIGDDSMEKMNVFNEAGAGVDESVIHDVDGDPNADVGLPRLPGSED